MDNVDKLVSSLLEEQTFQAGAKVWVRRGKRLFQGEVVDYDASTDEYLVRYAWKDPNHLGQGGSTVIVKAGDLSPVPGN